MNDEETCVEMNGIILEENPIKKQPLVRGPAGPYDNVGLNASKCDIWVTGTKSETGG